MKTTERTREEWLAEQERQANQLRKMTEAEAEKIGKAYSHTSLSRLTLRCSDLVLELHEQINAAVLEMIDGRYSESHINDLQNQINHAKEEKKKLQRIENILVHYQFLKAPADSYATKDCLGNPVTVHTQYRSYRGYKS